ncbi:MAG: hypothetical protein IPP32_05335 [Bacteroidetes bacterium]|nr:hypothetical protein [Bacteroidota bacterium]
MSDKSSKSSSNLEHYHNKGEQDASKGDVHRPHDVLFGLFNTDKQHHENDAYEKGANNYYQQKKDS